MQLRQKALLAFSLWLLHLTGFSFSEFWIKWALGLFILAGACWLPVVWMQIKMSNMAKHALQTNTRLPEQYWK